jgi:hypothetical protein
MAAATYDQFQQQIDEVRNSTCNAATFLALSEQALRLYAENRSRGESIAGQMTAVWYRYSSEWRDQRALEIGDLFADLDVPPLQVAGGEEGARAKWRAIGLLLQSGGEANRSPRRHE